MREVKCKNYNGLLSVDNIDSFLCKTNTDVIVKRWVLHLFASGARGTFRISRLRIYPGIKWTNYNRIEIRKDNDVNNCNCDVNINNYVFNNKQ